MIPCPDHLAELRKTFVVEEVLSSRRHDLANKLASIRNAVFYVRRQVEARAPSLQEDPRIQQFLGLIDTELDQAAALLRPDLPAPESTATTHAGVETSRSLSTLLRSIELPRGVSIDGPGGENVRLAADEREVQLAAFCLIENALEALRRVGGGRVRVDCVPLSDREAAVRVSDDGPGMSEDAAARAQDRFFSTTPGKLGVGLNVAARVARRWSGRIELDTRPHAGVVATLVLPRPWKEA